MATLTTQVQHLQEESTKLQEKLLAALEKLTLSERPTPPGRAPKRVSFGHYCWSCRHHSTHKGKDCHFKKEGHQDSTTDENKRGRAAAATITYRRTPGRFN